MASYHVQPPSHGEPSDAPVASSATKPTEAPPTQRSKRAIPKAPVSQPATMSSDTAGQSAPVTCDTSFPKTPGKGPGDTSRGYAFQFVSLSPGFMNRTQIPARTSSAPPNLGEQKHDLARHGSYRSVPSLPTPAPKPQLPRKDTTAADQSNIEETHLPKARKDTRVSHALPVSQTQKPSVHSIPITSVQMPYHLPQVSVQLGGSHPQIQSRGVTASSLPMGMPVELSMGNAPQMQQPLYVQDLPHPMQPQGIMHRAQDLGFPTEMGPLGGMQRNGPDACRWQRATNFQQKGLIPSPQTPLQMMHQADRKYEVAKVTDEEEAKQRQLKAILNKLTPQNFEKLFEQVKAVKIDNTSTLNGVISQIFDKALMEPTFCEMYANFCHRLAGELPDFSEDNEKITFKRVLLNKCQEEFERGEREQEEANKADEEGETKCSEEEREEKRLKARRRMLGNIRLIGELYKKKMLTERIMHECIKKLLGRHQNPDEEDVEALCTLMSTIGEMIDHPKAKEHMDAYFDIMTMLSNNMKLSSRLRFMLKDAIDLRENEWQQRTQKKIDQLY